MIDLDAALWVEYDDTTKQPLALIETARDVGQDYKTATVTQNLAKLCTVRIVPAYVVLYTTSENSRNPAAPSFPDITKFRVKRLWPAPVELSWTAYSPQEWAESLVELRKYAAAKVDETLQPKPTDPTPEELASGDCNGRYISQELYIDKPQPPASGATMQRSVFGTMK
jgi:hypothetical protein